MIFVHLMLSTLLCRCTTLHLGRRNVEPLRDRWVNGSRRLLGVGRNASVRRVVPPDKVGRVGNRDVTCGKLRSGGLSSDKTTPGLVALMNDLGGITFVLGLTRERKSVLRLSIGNLVDPEPLVGSPDQTRKMSLNVFNVIELGGERILDVDDDDLPVGLSLIEKGHDSENLDLLDLADVANLLANLTDIERVVVALGLGLSMGCVGVLPSLRESTVVPDVTVVREAVANVAEPASLNILLDRIEGFFFGDFQLGVGPARNFDDHVENAAVLVSKEGDVMPWGDDRAVLFDENAMLERVGSADLARAVLRSHVLSGGIGGQMSELERESLYSGICRVSTHIVQPESNRRRYSCPR